MDLMSYAELAVLLVNTAGPFADLDELHALLAGSGLADPACEPGEGDLAALRALRAELAAVFEAADRGEEEAVADRLNVLLVRHPVRPQISGHDGRRWHLHLTESGGAADRYAVGAVMGLATLVTEFGMDRLGLCQASGCRRAFLDTSSNRSRRYCSERCASRANVAAYRARRRQTPRSGQ